MCPPAETAHQSSIISLINFRCIRRGFVSQNGFIFSTTKDTKRHESFWSVELCLFSHVPIRKIKTGACGLRLRGNRVVFVPVRTRVKWVHLARNSTKRLTLAVAGW